MRRNVLLTILTAIWVIAWFHTGATASREVVVGVYQNAPLVSYDPKAGATGIFPEILSHIADKEGWRLTYRFGSFDECMHWLDTGEIELMPAIAAVPERMERYRFTDETVISHWGQVYRHVDARIEDLIDLTGKHLAVVRGDIYFDVFQQVDDSNDEVIGTVYIQHDLSEMNAAILLEVVTMALSVMACSFAAYLVSLRLQRVISAPILSLAGVAKSVSEKKDYSVRAVKKSNDEVGSLINATAGAHGHGPPTQKPMKSRSVTRPRRPSFPDPVSLEQGIECRRGYQQPCVSCRPAFHDAGPLDGSQCAHDRQDGEGSIGEGQRGIDPQREEKYADEKRSEDQPCLHESVLSPVSMSPPYLRTLPLYTSMASCRSFSMNSGQQSGVE